MDLYNICANQLELLEGYLLQVTHDINNAMNVIQLELEDNENQVVINKIFQITKMIHSLQSLAKNSPDFPCRINTCIENTLLHFSINKNFPMIDLLLKYEGKPLLINGLIIKQIILNLIIPILTNMNFSEKNLGIVIATETKDKGAKIIFSGGYNWLKNNTTQSSLWVVAITKEIIKNGGSVEISQINQIETLEIYIPAMPM